MTAATAIPEFTRELWTDSPPGDDTTTSMGTPRGQGAEGRIPGTANIVRIVPDPKDEDVLGVTWEKLLFPLQLFAFGLAGPVVAKLTAELSQIGYPGDAIATSTPWPSLWRQPEPDPGVWRGVFAIRHRRRELFSEVVELDLRSLPRRRPHITLTRRMLEANDE